MSRQFVVLERNTFHRFGRDEDLPPSGAPWATLYAAKWSTTLARSLALIIEQDRTWLAYV